ncbi:MAG: ABC transporter substrate-binding protein [Bacteroidia bacterium]|nr:ABC transporter substrate-binding protein [Bacteroidia bacterium]
MRKWLIIIIPVLLCTCGAPDNVTDKMIFRYNEMAGITSLDPAAANNLENIWAVNQLFNGLVQLDDSLHVIPSIASSWTVSDDGKVYVFKLRHDVFFHDNEYFPDGKGRQVVADDFLKSFIRLHEHPSEQSAKFLFHLMDLSDPSRPHGCDSPDTGTFRIFLKDPYPPLLEVLTMQYFSVIPVEIAERYGEEWRYNPVGTGPFRFRIWEEGSKLVMAKNDNYFETENGVRLPFLDAVTVTFIRDREAMMGQFMAGKLDMVSGADVINRDMVLDNEGNLQARYTDSFLIQKSSFMKTDYMGFLVDGSLDQMKNNPLLDKRIRQALNYTVDKEKMIKYLRKGIGVPAVAGFIPVGMPSYAPAVTGYTYDPEKARRLLKDAGYPNGKGLPQIVMNITPPFQQLSEFMEVQMEDAGFDIRININQTVVHRDEVENSKLPFFRKTWVADYADAENFLSIFYSKNFSPEGSNYFHFKNEQFDRLYDSALKVNNREQRYALYREMDQILMDEAVVMPLYYDEVLRLVNRKVVGLHPNAMNLLQLKRVKKLK